MEEIKNNKAFRDPSEVGDELFSYLGKVRESDDPENIDYTSDADLPQDSDAPRMPGNGRTGTLTTRMGHISSDKPAYAGSSGLLGNITIMPRPMQRKHASMRKCSGVLSRLGKIKLSDISKFQYKMFGGNNALASAAYGGLAALGTYAAAPHLMRLLFPQDPVGYDRKTGEPVYITPEDRKYSSLAVGLGLAGMNLVKNINFKNFKWDQLWKMPKVASMLGPVDYVPTDFAMNAVALNPDIPDYLKYNTLNALGTINSPNVSSTDMVNAGIRSGVSGSTGLPVGRIAAAATADALTAYGIGKLIGSSDPSNFATATGVVSLLGRTIANSF